MNVASRVPRESGFTLIELLLSVLVLSFGLLGLAGLQVHVVKADAFNRDMTVATAIGTGLVEEIVAEAQAVGMANLNSNLFTSGDEAGSAEDYLPQHLGLDPYNGRYKWNRTLDMRSNFAIVDVVVRWPNRYDAANDHQLRFRDVVR